MSKPDNSSANAWTPFTLSVEPAHVDRPPVPQTSGALASDILTEAAKIVAGARNTQHGEKERSFEAIAAMWTAYLATRKGSPTGVSAVDVAWMMTIMKIVRANQGQFIRDHSVDAAGYAAIAGELAKVA